jgi:hypothetical protein
MAARSFLAARTIAEAGTPVASRVETRSPSRRALAASRSSLRSPAVLAVAHNLSTIAPAAGPAIGIMGAPITSGVTLS